MLEEILNSHCAALEERPSRTRTKVQNMRKGLLVVSNNKQENSNQIYGKLALAGEKSSALPSSGSGVSH